jgi:hypothetical protein
LAKSPQVTAGDDRQQPLQSSRSKQSQLCSPKKAIDVAEVFDAECYACQYG